MRGQQFPLTGRTEDSRTNQIISIDRRAYSRRGEVRFNDSLTASGAGEVREKRGNVGDVMRGLVCSSPSLYTSERRGHGSCGFTRGTADQRFTMVRGEIMVVPYSKD